MSNEQNKQVDAGARYIVIGYGETDNPQAAFANTQGELLDAVLGMMYTHPSDADAEIREAYRKDLDDEDEWTNDGIWRTEFEIGGIVIYDTGERVGNSAALSASTEAAAGEPMTLTFIVDPSQRVDDVLPTDRRWVISKSIGLVAAYRNCAVNETKEVMQQFVDYMRAALTESAASGQKLTDEQIAALRVAADALIERYAEPIRAILRNAERVDGLTVQGLRTLMMRHAKSYSEWDCGSLERVDFGQYGFDEFARALLRASEGQA